MKKKVILVLLTVALLAIVIGAAIIAKNNSQKTPVNTSRRDGEVVENGIYGDDDLML